MKKNIKLINIAASLMLTVLFSASSLFASSHDEHSGDTETPVVKVVEQKNTMGSLEINVSADSDNEYVSFRIIPDNILFQKLAIDTAENHYLKLNNLPVTDYTVITYKSGFYKDTTNVTLKSDMSISVSLKEKEIDSPLRKIINSTGIVNFIRPRVDSDKENLDGFIVIAKDKYATGEDGIFPPGVSSIIMILIGILLIWLAIKKQFEPLLLLPIGFGGILANIPIANIGGPDGFLGMIYGVGIATGIFPLIIFMGVGAMTDFGPLLANPKTALLGAAAQFGIFATVLGAVVLSEVVPGINFSLRDAASIGIIGGADGPTAIFLSSQLSPHLLGAIAVAAYSYMALVPIIQPPIIRAFTNSKERKIEMKQLRHVSKREKIFFPLSVLALCILLLPDATPLIGALMFGNLIKESGVVERLSKTAQNELINIVTIFLGLAVGSRLSGSTFLTIETIGIVLLGLAAFCLGTASGVIMGKIMNKFSKDPINPMIGGAGVSAVPMAARIVNKVGLEENPQNFLLMHAMGPNVAGVIGSAVAAGVLLAVLG